eukprot:NODE_1090_length_1472_cov_62.510781_g1079_i0.p1 GENE.NODE_1090_length_1472_cov_62.510781_g1079_i0~~NODE_1090_length_1472_cov_62.510781_g1079_i0.p1  ORF type:complete len:352 (+),score=16.48 NODE_1090_length_1472_cov_62.510781_g1079_i0:121-1176(+)
MGGTCAVPVPPQHADPPKPRSMPPYNAFLNTGRVWDACFNESGSQVVVAHRHGITVWDCRHKKRSCTLCEDSWCMCVRWHRRGWVTGTKAGVLSWFEPTTGRKPGWKPATQLRHTCGVRSIAVGHDSDLVLATAGQDGYMRHWQGTELAVSWKLIADPPTNLHYCMDDTAIAYFDQCDGLLYDLRAGTVAVRWPHFDRIRDIAVDGINVLTLAGDSLRFWDTRKPSDSEHGSMQAPRLSLGHLWKVSYSPCGKYAICGGDCSTGCLVSLETRERVVMLEGCQRVMAVAPRRGVMATSGCDNSIELWNLQQWLKDKVSETNCSTPHSEPACRQWSSELYSGDEVVRLPPGFE